MRFEAMTTEEFNGFGRALYGMRWKARVGRALGITAHHVHRLATGATPVSAAIAGKLCRSMADVTAGRAGWVDVPGTNGRMKVEVDDCFTRDRRAVALRKIWQWRIAARRRLAMRRSRRAAAAAAGAEHEV